MATIRDIARSCGRSTATVDRVLNNRPGVSEATRRVILKAAGALKYHRTLPGHLSLDFILPNVGAFMRNLAEHLESANAAADAPRATNIHFVDFNSPEKIAELLESLRGKAAGVGLVAMDHILIREALRSLIDANIPVITLLTDIASLSHQGYIGIDNRLAGRLAGHLIGRFLSRASGDVAVFTGSRAIRGHEEREMGFRSVLRERYPHLRIGHTHEIGESDQAGFQATKQIMESKDRILGIYNVGAGSGGIARALQGVSHDVRPVFIAHDLSQDTRFHLLDGTIDALIDQNAEVAAQRAVARLHDAVNLRMLGVCGSIDTRIIFTENIPQR